MKFISTKTHGYLDYGMGTLLSALPFIMKYNLSAPESTILYLCGGLVLLLAICTRFEAGVVGLLSVTAHLTTDVIAGAVLALSPTLFAFGEQIYLPHIVLGLLMIVISLLTTTVAGPGAKRSF